VSPEILAYCVLSAGLLWLGYVIVMTLQRIAEIRRIERERPEASFLLRVLRLRQRRWLPRLRWSTPWGRWGASPTEPEARHRRREAHAPRDGRVTKQRREQHQKQRDQAVAPGERRRRELGTERTVPERTRFPRGRGTGKDLDSGA
jgi:hypothetical protein